LPLRADCPMALSLGRGRQVARRGGPFGRDIRRNRGIWVARMCGGGVVRPSGRSPRLCTHRSITRRSRHLLHPSPRERSERRGGWRREAAPGGGRARDSRRGCQIMRPLSPCSTLPLHVAQDTSMHHAHDHQHRRRDPARHQGHPEKRAAVDGSGDLRTACRRACPSASIAVTTAIPLEVAPDEVSR
jgi:hypothetical protein